MGFGKVKMSRKYKPQHMKQKEVTPMFNHKGAPKAALTAALTVAIAAPSARGTRHGARAGRPGRGCPP